MSRVARSGGARPGVRPTAIVVVGASAGGVQALRALVAGLPASIAAPVVVVLHIPRNAPSALAAILDRAGPMLASTAADGEPLTDGHLYVAPADRHVLVRGGRLHLSTEPPQNGHRPAIDPLLRTAALAYGSRTIGIVLSGNRNDGTAGLAAITERGGTALVQDPDEALYPAMPRNALRAVLGSMAFPVSDLGSEVCRLLAVGRPG
jgi:two-component system, chemotaxis family, protein-glutamate methylesterase/glutaminase